jgi:redox-sensitive bicupin YhaK (pirin superfamily)
MGLNTPIFTLSNNEICFSFFKNRIMTTVNSNQKVKKAAINAQLQQQSHGRGFLSADLSLQRFPIEPFIVATDFHMAHPFFPPHPHAGVSVLTYIFEDSQNAFINRDSFGDKSRIEAGGLHLTQAGKGIQHEEVPEIDGLDAHGLQLWVNHAATDRLVPAKAFHANKADIPELFPTKNNVFAFCWAISTEQKEQFKPLRPLRFSMFTQKLANLYKSL